MNIECVKTVREMVSMLPEWKIISEEYVDNTWQLHVKAKNGAEIKTAHPKKMSGFITVNRFREKPSLNGLINS